VSCYDETSSILFHSIDHKLENRVMYSLSLLQVASLGQSVHLSFNKHEYGVDNVIRTYEVLSAIPGRNIHFWKSGIFSPHEYV